MEKIYGYKQKDVIGLAEFIMQRKGGTLTSAFYEYAKRENKAQGTVRNLYYALAKKSRTDNEFCQKYLGGKPLCVGKIVEFSQNEEIDLVKAILKEKLNGKSVRQAILELSKGDNKLALRYQNKYRNFVKNSPEQVEKFCVELSGGKVLEEDCQIRSVSSLQLRRLKAEINGLVDKISFKAKKENERLSAKVAFLERENARLRQELGEKTQKDKVLHFFIKNDQGALKL